MTSFFKKLFCGAEKFLQPPPPHHSSKEEAGTAIVHQRRTMQSDSVDADAFEKNTPEWLQELVSHPAIQPHLLGDVFWSLNARSSAPSHIQKSAYDLSYLVFALRKFTLTRKNRVVGFEAPGDGASKKKIEHFVRDFDDIFQLRAAFISEYDHYCSDESSGANQFEISLQQQLPCDSVAESLRPHLIPQVVRDVLQDVISTHTDGLEFHEKHMADFFQALIGESEFPNEIRENLENYVSLRGASHSQPSDQALSNFELLSCCCIFQFYARYAKRQNELQNPPLNPSFDALPQPLPCTLIHRAHSYDDLDVVLPHRGSMALEKTCKDDLQLSTSESRQQQSAAANAYDLNSDMLKLRVYLKDLHRAIVNLHYSLLYWVEEDVAEKFAKLQRVLVEHKDLLFYGENDSDNDRQMRIRIERQKHEHVALAFRVLRQMILDTEYFKDLRRSIDELVANFNTALKDRNVDVVQPTNEMFSKLCKAVALEQLHFAFDILEATQGADLGFRVKTRAAEMEAQPPSAPRGAAATANVGVAERAIKQTSSSGAAAAVADDAVYTWLDLEQTSSAGVAAAAVKQTSSAGVAAAAVKQTSSAGVAAAVAGNAVYTWLDLKGTVLSVALANELEADLKLYKPRQSIYKRLCSFACA